MFWFLASPALCYHAFPATQQLSDSVETRWIGTCHHGTEFQRAYVALQIVATGMEFIKSGKLEDKLPMVAHHVLSCVCYTAGLATGRMHFWANFDGCCEATTFFVSFIQMSRMKGSLVDTWTKQNTIGKLLFQINGVLAWLSFIVFRLVLFTVWLSLFAWDLQSALPAEIWAKLTRPELCFYPFVTLFLLVLSAQWFMKIHRGMMKALGAPEEEKGTVKAKKKEGKRKDQ